MKNTTVILNPVTLNTVTITEKGADCVQMIIATGQSLKECSEAILRRYPKAHIPKYRQSRNISELSVLI